MGYLISTITPVYNAEKYLQRAFDSIKNQTIGFENIQVILVDDCSTDKSSSMIKAWADEYENVIALKTDKNSGSASVPRNLGMKHATAPYMMFLDNDDWFENDACEALYNEMQKSGADLVTGYYRDVNDDGTHMNERCASCDIDEAIDRKEFILPADFMEVRRVEMIFWCKIYKRSIIEENNLTFVLKSAHEDIVFLVRYLLLCKKLVYINKLIYNYNIRLTSLSNSLTAEYLIDRANSYVKILDYYTKAGQAEFFNKYYGLIAPDNMANIFLSEKIKTKEDREKTLAAWSEIVGYIADNCDMPDEAHRAVYKNWADGKFELVEAVAPIIIELDKKTAGYKKDIQDLSERVHWFDEQYTEHCETIKHLLAEQEDQALKIADLHSRLSKNAEEYDASLKQKEAHYSAALAQANEQLAAEKAAKESELAAKDSEIAALNARIDAIRRSRAFKAACLLSKNLKDL